MREPVFRGIGTALITPMNQDGSVNFEQYGKLIDWQIEQGIDAIIAVGTTGEGSTLNDAEHKKCIEFAVDRAAGRVPIIAGTGSNDVAYGLQLTKFACDAGVDGCLVVTPYYNKITQNGLVRMYNTYADAATKPIIVYNVPSRTGVNIEPATYAKIAEHENISAVKEANGNISKIVETQSLIHDKMYMYSGNDDQIVPMMSVGAIGCISVLANVFPAETHQIAQKMFDGDVAGAAAMQFQYLNLIKALFCEVNPIPVKAAMAAMGWCGNNLRPPMYPMEEQNRQRLLAEMRAQGLNV